jgi:hypothetical protein
VVLLGPFAVVAAVLVVAAVAKLAVPAATAEVMTTLRLPASAWVVRVLGSVELAVGGAALIVGGRTAAGALAVVFTAFTAVTVPLVARASDTSCGCFGALSSPVGRIHVVSNAAAALVALAGLGWPVPGLVADHGRLPAAGVAHGVLVVAGAVLVVAILGPLRSVLDASGAAAAAAGGAGAGGGRAGVSGRAGAVGASGGVGVVGGSGGATRPVALFGMRGPR